MRAWIRRLCVIAALAIGLVVRSEGAQACTTFSSATPSGPIVAKSFDWVTGEGWLVINERSRIRSPLFPDTAAKRGTWVSSLASLSLTTVGPGLPVSGMNEAGLAIEALVDFSAARTMIPEPGILNGLEFIQYGLDKFDSVMELADFAQEAHISLLGVPLHYFSCDRSGACVIIEVRHGLTRVTRHPPVRALANRSYSEDLAATRPSWFERWFGQATLPSGSSQARFHIAANGVAAGFLASESDALSLLEQVALRQMKGWQTVWNLERLTLLLHQGKAGLGATTLAFRDLMGPCRGAPPVRAMGRAGTGSFAPWSDEDVLRSQRLLSLQLGRSTGARRLARIIAEASRSSRCSVSE